MKTKHLIFAGLLQLGLSIFLLPPLYAQGTAFTYQGRLNSGTNPATGSYDLRFALYTSTTGGTASGTLTNAATSVTNGLFTVTLDFGGMFNGTNYWLELAVRTNGSGGFTTLSPRQPVTPAPYAIYSAIAGSAATATTATTANYVEATNITGTVMPSQLPSNGNYLTNVSAGAVAGVVTNGQSSVTLDLTNTSVLESGVLLKSTLDGNNSGSILLGESRGYSGGPSMFYDGYNGVLTIGGTVNGIWFTKQDAAFLAKLDGAGNFTIYGNAIVNGNLSVGGTFAAAAGFSGDGSLLTTIPTGSTGGYLGQQQTPPIVFNTFYDNADVSAAFVNETNFISLIKTAATSSVATGLKNAGVTPYFVIDDGWQAWTRTNGQALGYGTNFPDGMAFMAGTIASNGMDPGIYTSYSTMACSGRAGTPDAASAYLDVAEVANWGYTYLKVDDCARDLSYTNALFKLRIFSSAVQSLPNSILLDCSDAHWPPSDWLGAMANVYSDWSSRGVDYLSATGVADVLPLAVTPLAYPKLTGAGHFFRLAGISYQSAPYPAATKALFTLDAILPAAEQLGPSLSAATTTIGILTNAYRLKVHQNLPVFPGFLAASNAYSQIIVRPLNYRGDAYAVALFNADTAASHGLMVSPAMLNTTNSTITVFDCYGQTNVGSYANSGFTYNVAANDCALLLANLSPAALTTNIVIDGHTFYYTNGLLMNFQ